MTPTKRPRGRPPKFPPDEVRRKLIEAAIATLRVRGVESGLDAVTLDGAILDADVPRGMSYKIWRVGDETPQDAFRHATVLDILSIPAIAGLPATREFTKSELASRQDEVDSADPDVRRRLVTDLIRRVGEFNHEALESNENWQLYTALRSAAITRPDADPAVMEALAAGEEFLIGEYSSFYSEVAERIGLRLKDGLTMQEFSAAAYSLNEGISMRLGTSYRRTNIPLNTGRNGAEESWSLFAVCLEAIIMHFFDWVDR